MNDDNREQREKGVAESNGYTPVGVDRLEMIELLSDLDEARTAVVNRLDRESEFILAREILLALGESRHLQTEDGWRRMVDVLGSHFALDEVES